MSEAEIRRIDLPRLVFDHQNPRLVEFELGDEPSEKDIIQVLWATMDVWELVQSIAASGFFAHETLLVLADADRYIVIEGNRRLAAVKILLDPGLVPSRRVRIPAITAEQRESLSQLPSQLVQSREAAWRYLGFKHVNGPAKWSSFAKSQYIADVYRNVKVGLEDIARQIGDNHRTVYRLYRGLMVLEQAERLDVFDREDRWKGHFSFSHLYTGLDYSGIRSFLALRETAADSNNFVPDDKKGELGELLLWLYGSKRKDTKPIVQRQNPDLRQLDAVVANVEAIAALRNGFALEYAFEKSRPVTNRFAESLQESKAKLEHARALLSEGYHGAPQLLSMAGAVVNLASDLYDEMARKSSPGRRRRITEIE